MVRVTLKSVAVVLVALISLGSVGDAQAALREPNSPFLLAAGTSGEKRSGICSDNSSSSECYDASNRLATELSMLGGPGDLIARVRNQTLEILSSDNNCTAWFQAVEPDVADVFRSLHYDIDANGTAEIYSIKDSLGDFYLKHPWGARSVEDAGRNAFIELNGNGPFFVRKTHVTPSDARAAVFPIAEPQPTYIGPYMGASSEARLTIMLHELGHIVGRIPKDDDSWDGRSSQNTREVLRHCKKEIREMAHRQ